MSIIRVNDCNHYYKYMPAHNSAHPTLVMINGVFSTAHSWTPIVSELLEDGYGVLVYEYRGQWRTELTQPPYSYAQLANDLHALINALNIESPHLVGNSLGGEIALRYALDYPDALDSLTVIAAAAEPDEILVGTLCDWIDAAETIVARGSSGESLERQSIEFFKLCETAMYSEAFRNDNAELIHYIRDAFTRSVDIQYYAGLTYLLRMSLHELLHEPMLDRLNEIECETLIINGGQDTLKPAITSVHIADSIRDASHVCAHNAGHCVTVEAPTQVIDCLRYALGKSTVFMPLLHNPENRQLAN